jgi:hypothetical protein
MKIKPMSRFFLFLLGSTLSLCTGAIAQNQIGPTDNVGIGTLTPSEKLTIYNGNQLFRKQFGTGADYDWFTIGSQEQGEKLITGVFAGILGTNINPKLNGDGKPTTRNEQPTNAYRQAWALTFGSGDSYNNFSIWGARSATAGTALSPLFNISSGGNVSIGTTDARGYKLAVAGNFIAEKAVVKLSANWPDFVFNTAYQLPSLEEVEAFITANKHLSGIPSAEEVREKGHDLGEMNQKLLQKVEELTLYLIDLQKQLKSQQEEIKALKDQSTGS